MQSNAAARLPHMVGGNLDSTDPDSSHITGIRASLGGGGQSPSADECDWPAMTMVVVCGSVAFALLPKTAGRARAGLHEPA